MKDPKTFLGSLDQLMASPKAGMLTERQYEDLKNLQNKAMASWEKGERDQARKIMAEMKEIVEEGPPVGETHHGAKF
jgi:hypothetical protein